MSDFKLIILIPHFNNPEGLLKSLSSISCENQAHIVVVDDGSEKENQPGKNEITANLNVNVSATILYLERNMGIEHALNFGLKYINDHFNAEYIARLDCGDICLKERFNKQIRFLENYRDIHLVGTWAEVVDEHNQHLYNLKVPVDHYKIKKMMMIAIGFVHPSIMFRSEALDVIGFYPLNFTTAEDYAFLFKFIKRFRTANIPEILLKKERTSQSVSTTKRRKQILTRLRVIWYNRMFSLYFVYGMFRTLFLLIVPYSVMEFIKEKVLK